MNIRHGKCRRTEGVALVIVLGLLAILTILAVAFASAMWVERIAAWNHANSIRAKALVDLALVRAMTEVNLTMAGRCYPCFTNWPSGRYDAMGSRTNSTGPKLTNLLSGEAYVMIPSSLWPDAKVVNDKYCYWSNVVVNGKTNGRIAYIVVNASGLVDINQAGGQNRNFCTNIAEIDPGNLLLPGAFATFINSRNMNRRYETMTEAMLLANSGIPNPHDGFATFSLDPSRDQYFRMSCATDVVAMSTLGKPDAWLTNKFNLNAITNYSGYYNSWDYYAFAKDTTNFMPNYYWPLVALLSMPRTNGATMMERPEDVAWNIINYLDPDRIPSVHLGKKPWNSTEGSEALPLINEIVLKPYSNSAGAPAPVGAVGVWSNYYEFVVELWYPFAPTIVTPADKFFLWVGVFTNPVAALAADEFSITNYAVVATNFTFSSNILNMAYGTSNEFVCIRSPLDKKICFRSPPVFVTNSPLTYTNYYLPIGSTSYTDGTGTQFKVDNCVWFLARVYKQESYGGITTNVIVDEAMGYDNSGSELFANVAYPGDRKLKVFTNTVGYSVPEPRSNGRIKYWWPGFVAGGGPIGGTSYFWTASAQTLGTTNVNCDPWSRKGSGLPIFFTNGPMDNVGELGYIFRGNLDDEQPVGDKWWRTINLMHFDEGAALVDWCTVRHTNVPAYGLFAINSRQTNSVRALFNNMKIGYVSGPATNFVYLTTPAIDKIVAAIITNGPYVNVRCMFTSEGGENGGGGPIADALRYAGTNNPAYRGDIYGEDPFRRIVELITFRQNMFIVAVAAQVFGGDGATVVGEKRGVATIYRDSYTGRYFIRSFKWLSD